MADITIGQVSGLIALAVFIVQPILPLILVAILVSLLRDEYNAVTWSVIGRCVQSSSWPSILRADPASTRKVELRVSILSWLVTLSFLLMSIAAVITPLGLKDQINLHKAKSAHFQYAPDMSTFGYGTPPRYNRFSRLCGSIYGESSNCPGASVGHVIVANASEIIIANSTIPANITEVFSSATSDDGNTLSGAFDAQFRSWLVYADNSSDFVDAGQPYSMGSYRAIESLILHNKTEPIEGLVVDTVHGGIGLRNHTLPTELPYGGRWTEDLTWIEPVTTCIDTNLTLRFSIDRHDSSATHLTLIDNGGFSRLSPDYPAGFWNDSQNPDLRSRAYKGAWISNALSAAFLNNSTVGRVFPLGDRSPYIPTLDTIKISDIDGGFLNFDQYSPEQGRLSVTPENFTDNLVLCPGFGGSDRANISNMMIACGYLYGAPQRDDGVQSLVFEPFKNWTQSLYVCATGVRASVKTVGFSINGSTSLSDLQIISLEDKNYTDNISKPLWAMEDTNYFIGDINPFWGLVNDRYENSSGLATIRADSFWLPAVLSDYVRYDSSASSRVFASALTDVYQFSASVTSLGMSSYAIGDYTGTYNMALSRLWSQLSRSPSTASSIINLIYTDIVSTAIVGTKSSILKSSIGAKHGTPNALAQVTRYRRQIKYNWLYAIPAAFILALIGVTIILLLVLSITSRFSIHYMRQLLNQISTDRLVTNILYPNISQPTAPTSKWVSKAGLENLAFGKGTGRESSRGRQTQGGMSQQNTTLTFGRVRGNGSLLCEVLT